MSDSKSLPDWCKFLFASMSGIGATLVCYPLDFVKTRMQVAKSTQRISSLQLAKTIIQQEGITALYTGLSASCLRQATYTGVRMGAFQTMVDYFTDENGVPPNLLIKSACGVLSGAMGGIAGLPADVALTRMAADGAAPPDQRRNYKGAFDALGRIVKEEGAGVLFRGMDATVFRAAVVNISQLVSYSQGKEILLKSGLMKDGTGCHVVCSVFSAFVATTCALPPDMAKTRMQNMIVKDGKPEYTGMLDVWAKIAKREGALALWKGFTPLFLRNGPQFVVFFVIYENLVTMYKKFVMKK